MSDINRDWFSRLLLFSTTEEWFEGREEPDAQSNILLIGICRIVLGFGQERGIPFVHATGKSLPLIGSRDMTSHNGALDDLKSSLCTNCLADVGECVYIHLERYIYTI